MQLRLFKETKLQINDCKHQGRKSVSKNGVFQSRRYVWSRGIGCPSPLGSDVCANAILSIFLFGNHCLAQCELGLLVVCLHLGCPRPLQDRHPLISNLRCPDIQDIASIATSGKHGDDDEKEIIVTFLTQRNLNSQHKTALYGKKM